MTHDERSALIRRVVAEAKRERARAMRSIFSAILATPYRIWSRGHWRHCIRPQSLLSRGG